MASATTTETTRSAAGVEIDGRRPYRPSWLDALFGAMTALPGPTWLAYSLLLLPSILLSNSSLWLSGLLPVGQFDPLQVFWGISTVGLLGASHFLRNTAGDAFERFRPALGAADVDVERERFELTTMPARAVMIITAFNALITPAYYLADPAGTATVGLAGLGFVGRFISEVLVGIFLIAIAYQGIRQIRRVRRLHAVAEEVDPFNPAPLYAFARLTALTAAILVGFNALGFAASPGFFTSSGASLAFGLAWLSAITVAAAAIFVVPLLGMHSRLESIRDGYVAAAGARLRILLAELNDAIDARDATKIGALDLAIGALRREREVLAALPIWPWSTGTLRGVVSALALPIALFLIQRLLTRVLG